MAQLNIGSLIGLPAIIFSSIATPAQALLRTEFEDFVRNSNTELAQIFAEKGYAFADELSRMICNDLSYYETTDVYRELIQSGIPPSGASQILSNLIKSGESEGDLYPPVKTARIHLSPRHWWSVNVSQ